MATVTAKYLAKRSFVHYTRVVKNSDGSDIPARDEVGVGQTVELDETTAAPLVKNGTIIPAPAEQPASAQQAKS